MKLSDLQNKDVAGLKKEISELLKTHFNLRMLKASQQLTDHSQLGKVKRNIARVNTVLAQKNQETK